MDNFEVLVITGVASTVLATIIVNKWLNPAPTQQAQPNTVTAPSPSTRGGELWVQTPMKTSMDAAPIAQNNPITEAAYNQQPFIAYEPAFGRRTHHSPNPPVLPI